MFEIALGRYDLNVGGSLHVPRDIEASLERDLLQRGKIFLAHRAGLLNQLRRSGGGQLFPLLDLMQKSRIGFEFLDEQRELGIFQREPLKELF